MANLKIASIYVISNNFYNWVTHQKIDICLIQERFCTSTFVPFFNSWWKGKIHHATTDSCQSRGVFIMLILH